MSTKSEVIQIANFAINVVRKDIKNMHLAVYPPKGIIRLSVPTDTEQDVLRLFAISKLGWLKKQVKKFKEQARETERDYISGESHYYQGKRYILEVKEHKGYSRVEFAGSKKIRMLVPIEASKENKSKVMREWYRRQLKQQIPPLLKKWESVIGVKATFWGVKQMKTKWGTCNPDSSRVWLNLELAKKPIICLEYILVHELVHLHESTHNERFVFLMDKFMPKWRQYRDELNSLPVVHNDWGY